MKQSEREIVTAFLIGTYETKWKGNCNCFLNMKQSEREIVTGFLIGMKQSEREIVTAFLIWNKVKGKL